MKSSVKIIFALLMSIIFSGCALIEGRPSPPPVDVEKISEGISTKLENIDNSEIDTIKERNAAINDALILIDLRYTQFILDAGLEQRKLDFASDFVELSLNLAGTAVGGAGLKTLLSALSAGISSTELAFDKSFVYEKTIPALVMQMESDRTEKRLEIIENMNKNIDGTDGYSWSMAVYDLINYYTAGTLQSAISSIKKNAGNKQTIAEEKIKKINKLVSNVEVKTAAELTGSLNKINVITQDSQREKIKAIFTPIAAALKHLPNCKKLDSLSPTTNQEIKDALQECIRDTNSREELAVLELKFREINLLTN